MNFSIRKEFTSDYRQVEELTYDAFWNLYVPGCDEHYLVHKMRNHPDFIQELDFVAAQGQKIIGNIMFTRSTVIDEKNISNKINTITFGPVSVLPEFQRKGIGSALIQHSIKIAKKTRCNAIIIQGHPHNYCKHGFKSSKDYNISDVDGKFPFSLLVLELENNIFNGKSWKYHESDVYKIDQNEVTEFNRNFKTKIKAYNYSQEEYSIASRAYLV